MKIKYFLVGVAALLGITTLPVFADLGGFTIEKYDVTVNVQEDGELDITEKILVNFSEERHGIYRDIPYRYQSEDGYYNISIYDIFVDNDLYEISKGGDYISIKIGDPDATINGLKEYTLKYKVYGGITHWDGYQELYWNIIGNDWATTISGIHFTVNFPTKVPLDEENSWFAYQGYYGGTDDIIDIAWNNSHTILEGTIPYLDIYQAATIGVKLPAEYTIIDSIKEQARVVFLRNTFQSMIHNNIFYLSFLVPFFLFLFLYKKRKRVGDDEPTTDMVRYEPPKGFTPGEVGMLASCRVTNRQVFASVYERAIKGVVLLEREERSWILGGDKFLVIRKKELPAHSSDFDYGLWHDLFPGVSDTFDVTKRNITFLKSLQIHIKAKQTRLEKLLYTPESKKAQTTLYIIFGAIFVGLSSFAGLIRGTRPEYSIPLTPAIILSIIILILFAIIMDKKSIEGKKLYEEAIGFKKFMKTVEEPKLKQFLKEDPNYFEKMLPFAIALGLGTKRTDKFEHILKDYTPTWIHGYALTRGLNSSLSNINSSITTFGKGSAFGAGSSGGSGGGSGGGGGGGGGGSW